MWRVSHKDEQADQRRESELKSISFTGLSFVMSHDLSRPPSTTGTKSLLPVSLSSMFPPGATIAPSATQPGSTEKDPSTDGRTAIDEVLNRSPAGTVVEITPTGIPDRTAAALRAEIASADSFTWGGKDVTREQVENLIQSKTNSHKSGSWFKITDKNAKFYSDLVDFGYKILRVLGMGGFLIAAWYSNPGCQAWRRQHSESSIRIVIMRSA